LKEASDHHVEIMTNTVVARISREQQGFSLKLEGKGAPAELHADFLCLATGGYPKEDQYNWFSDFGHTIVKPVPSLFTFNVPKHSITALMGVSVPEAEIRIPAMKYKEKGPLLITHWGLSGPVVLRSSAWCARELESMGYNVRIVINWCAAYNENNLREQLLSYRMNNGSAKVKLRAAIAIPQRLWEYLAGESGVLDQKWSDLPSVVLNKFVKNLALYEMDIKGKTTFKEEFVTAGGIHLSEVDPNTMESRKLPHLYFAGEVLDVDGITGGYNFQHAWTSGYNAAVDIAGKSLH
jgi:predicted Rossmann fold flavoprotein